MTTLKQQQVQITVMITALQSSLVRLIAFESNDERNNEIKRAIFLHCAMILFYQKLNTLLDSPTFIQFFNKKLSRLLDEKSNKSLFLADLSTFKLPTYLEAQELISMVEFSAVILSETQKSLADNEREGDTFRIAGLILGILFAMGFVALGITIVSLPPEILYTLSDTSIIIGSVAGIFLTMLLVGLICDRQHSSYIDYSLKLFDELGPINTARTTLSLASEINFNKKTICPTGNLQKVSDFSIKEPLSESETKINIYRNTQSLFFSLPKEYTIAEADLTAIPCTKA